MGGSGSVHANALGFKLGHYFLTLPGFAAAAPAGTVRRLDDPT